MIPLLLLIAFQITPELKQHVTAGLAAKTAGDLDAAAVEFRKAAELAPGLAAAHMNLGAVLFEKRDYSNAIPPLQKALELNPDLPGAHAMLGASLLAQGYAAKSIPHLEQAQSDDLLGVALLDSGRVRDAIDRLESSLAKRPDDPGLLYYLSQAHARLAKQLSDRLRETAPDSPRTHQILGEAQAASGNREAAAQHFQSALAAGPDIRGIHYAQGELLLESGEYAKAEAEFRAETRLAPGNAAAAYKLGSALLNLGRVNDAIAELNRANNLQPGMPETLLELGKALNVAGDPAAAIPHLEQLLAAEQNTPLAAAAHFQLAQAYRKLGRIAEADRESKAFQQFRALKK